MEVASPPHSVDLLFHGQGRVKVTSSLFALNAKGIRQLAKTMESLEIPDSTDTVASVLSSFSLSLFLIVQPLMSSIQKDSLSHISSSWAGGQDECNLVSSA